MKNLLLAFICMMTYTFAEMTAAPTPPSVIVPPKPTHPIVKPPVKPIDNRPVLVREDYLYCDNMASCCAEYIKTIEQKDKEIDKLKKELERLKGKEFGKFQKNLQTEYEQELQKFDERKSGIKTKNIIDISDK